MPRERSRPADRESALGVDLRLDDGRRDVQPAEGGDDLEHRSFRRVASTMTPVGGPTIVSIPSRLVLSLVRSALGMGSTTRSGELMRSQRNVLALVLGIALGATLFVGSAVEVLDHRAAGCVADENWDGWTLFAGAMYCILSAALVVTAVRTTRTATTLLVWFVLTPVARARYAHRVRDRARRRLGLALLTRDERTNALADLRARRSLTDEEFRQAKAAGSRKLVRVRGRVRAARRRRRTLLVAPRPLGVRAAVCALAVDRGDRLAVADQLSWLTAFLAGYGIGGVADLFLQRFETRAAAGAESLKRAFS